MSHFYITTAIDYTNGTPHIGHAYEKLLADVIARYNRLKGNQTYLLTGVDQHGQKVQQTAEQEDVHPATYVRRVTKGFVKAWDALNISNDGWAETTNEEHKQCVVDILQKLFDEGQIYKKHYKGWYSIRQEQFLTDKERDENGNFGPEWGQVEERDEDNYYFKLSDHVQWLREFAEKRSDFIIPTVRRNEFIKAIDNTEGNDLCISRPKERLRWGIELPFDPEFVTFVWFDALINYISFAGYNKAADSKLPDFEKLWPANVHVIGKDIMVPSHSIYWPIMLHSLGFSDEQIPSLLVHGWWNKKSADAGDGEEKMSKSLGNIVDPIELVERFSIDAVRYYLMRDINISRDSTFDEERLVGAFNVGLANNLGNLCNRTLTLLRKNCDATEASDYDDELSQSLRAKFESTLATYQKHMDSYNVDLALEAVIEFLTEANIYAEKQAPWTLAKEEANKAQLITVLNHMLEAATLSSVLLMPVIPNAIERLHQQLKLETLDLDLTLCNLKWGMIPTGHVTAKPKPIFPRLSLEEA
ncbi:class I tRNA ligase family protein [Akkermansiaceae bacterium]|nr:class I tRNA ligase family protein [Akkermansiaceae bacterium]